MTCRNEKTNKSYRLDMFVCIYIPRVCGNRGLIPLVVLHMTNLLMLLSTLQTRMHISIKIGKNKNAYVMI